jgi:ribosomal-protein-alanine N-acetyltransferase
VGKSAKVLETERLILREMVEEDTEDFLGIFSDPVAMQYFNVIFDHDRMAAWVRSNLDHQQKHGFSLMTVILKDTGEIIGDCGLETDEIEGELTVGIGFDFKRRFWNQGYATEAAAAVRNYGFTAFGFATLSAWIDPENVASRRVAEKIGMTVHKLVYRGKKQYAIYSLTIDDWRSMLNIT